MTRERIEDLGVIREKMLDIIDDGELWRRCESKHSIEVFTQFYSIRSNLEDLHDKLRFMKDKLDDIYYIAAGCDDEGV